MKYFLILWVGIAIGIWMGYRTSSFPACQHLTYLECVDNSIQKGFLAYFQI